jgi:hypothetical protein
LKIQPTSRQGLTSQMVSCGSGASAKGFVDPCAHGPSPSVPTRPS